jgi:deoxyribodipyrimidine photolyase
MKDQVTKWLESLELDAKQKILATLIIELAADYERTRNTSTAEAIRKNISELSRSLDAGQIEEDPLTALIAEHKKNASTTRPLY